MGTRKRLEEVSRLTEWLKTHHPRILRQVMHVLYLHDPLRICDNSNARRREEYSPEATTIIPRLGQTHSPDDVSSVVWQEFVVWFGSSARPRDDRYTRIARDLWDIRRQYAAELESLPREYKQDSGQAT